MLCGDSLLCAGGCGENETVNHVNFSMF